MLGADRIDKSGTTPHGRACGVSDVRGGIAIVDIDLLRDVNTAHGHIIGEAVLVEVAAALGRQAVDDEIVARVGGDSFAVLFSSARSRQPMAKRLAAYKSVFERPFSTGDSEGKETVGVSATIGAAVGLDKAASFDEFFLRAEAVTIDAKAAGTRAPFAAGPERVKQV